MLLWREDTVLCSVFRTVRSDVVDIATPAIFHAGQGLDGFKFVFRELHPTSPRSAPTPGLSPCPVPLPLTRSDAGIVASK